MSGSRFTVEYTGWGGGSGGGDSDGEDGGRREPAFIRQFKQRAGIRPDASLRDKFSDENSPTDSSNNRGGVREGKEHEGARTEEEMPQIVVTPESGVTEAELAAVQSRIREAGETSQFEESRSRVRFIAGSSGKRKLATATAIGSDSGDKAAAMESKDLDDVKRQKPSSAGVSVCDKKLLSFDEEEGDD